ncbi:hypothetical protein [Pseudoxanthomonas mexicana]|nr:hypothetical protein [Pseudoxanthomonas mexicana]
MTDNDRRAERPLLPVGIGAGIAIGVAFGMGSRRGRSGGDKRPDETK